MAAAEPIYAAIGARIRARRKLVGLSQAALAGQISISRPALANIETGRQRVYIHHLFEIAARLDTAPGYLVPKPGQVERDVIYLAPRRPGRSRRGHAVTRAAEGGTA